MKNFLLFGFIFLVWIFSVNAQTIGDFQSHQSGNWSDVNSWERYDGSLWVYPAPGVPSSADGIISILNGNTITVDAAVTADQVIINATGTVVISVGQTLAIADGADSVDMIVNGTLNNFGTITVAGRISFENGGYYINSNSAAALPGTGFIAWRNGSTCRIDSTSGSTPSNLNLQNLFNLVWNGTNSGANGGPNFGDGYIIGGDLTILSSKGFQWRIANLSGGQTKNIYIRGNVNVNGSTALLTSTGSGADTLAKVIINVDGNINVTAGQLSLNNSGSAYAEWKIKGDVNITGGTLQSGSSGWYGRRTLNFVSGGTQTFTVTSPGTVGSAGTIFSSSNGTNVIVNFPFTPSAASAIMLAGGIFTTSSTNLITIPATVALLGGGSGSYINGPLAVTIASTDPTTKTFHIGKGSAYRPVTLTVNQDAATATIYTAEMFNAAPVSRTLPGTLGSVSSVRYYNITKGAGANLSSSLGATATFVYDADDGVTDASLLRTAKDDGSGNWISLGGSGTANTSGTITTNTFYSFSDFVLATANVAPIAASAIWQTTNSQAPVVSGLLDAANITYAGGLYHYGYNANGDRWTAPGGAWPYETSPNLTRYGQYSLSPKTGGTFNSDSITFKLTVEFTNYLRTAIYYSTDPTFATSTLVADVAVPGSQTYFSYPVSTTVATGQTLYIRVYPYDTNPVGDPAWKLVDIATFGIYGNTTGLAVLPPTVSTSAVTYISNTFATGGGNVSADGGGPVTCRGVCWSTITGPTISDSHTSDGTGNGLYTSSITGLIAGTPYFLRAYATNAGGTSYGNEISFSTLSAVEVPTCITSAITNLLVTSAVGGGNVTAWGGAPVTAKGVCWNITGSPTISDPHTTDGSDIGSFVSGIAPLVGNTPYFVRAYGTNSAGTGYGNEVSFTTQSPAADTTVIVAKDGSGNYTTVQAAFRDVPLNYTGHWTIFVKKGTYYEKDTLVTGKINVCLIGEDRDSTIITYDDYADRYGSGVPGTSGTFTIAIDASDFTARNITFRNTYFPTAGVTGTQAVALRTQGDRHEYVNCNILGYQDTYYTWGGNGTGRMYHKNCFIEGTVDFIFGRNIVVFDSCTIHEIRNTGTLTAGNTDGSSKYGYVFRNCKLYADSIGYDGTPITSYYLGRPWQASPRTVFLHCDESWNLAPAGWQTWNVTPGLYAEYNCFGPGSATGSRIISSQLNDSVANTYTLSNIFSKSSAVSNLILFDWMPVNAAGDAIPLPVELKSFTAAGVQNKVVVNWTTSTEINCSSFEVERKFNNSQWIKVGFLKGSGTTNIEHSYSFTDANLASGKYLYRLKQIDMNGKFHYSKEAEAEVSRPLSYCLNQNYPNPFNPATTISYEIPVLSKVTLKVFDILGKEVATLVDEKKEPGRYQIQFVIGNLASGVYIYQLRSDKFIQSRKMILLK